MNWKKVSFNAKPCLLKGLLLKTLNQCLKRKKVHVTIASKLKIEIEHKYIIVNQSPILRAVTNH